MIVKRINGATMTFGAPHDTEPGEVRGLPVRQVVCEIGEFYVSAWEPTPAEIQAMIDGETVKLWVRGPGHPVVALTVGTLPVVE
jgi:hypothetical protein